MKRFNVVVYYKMHNSNEFTETKNPTTPRTPRTRGAWRQKTVAISTPSKHIGGISRSHRTNKDAMVRTSTSSNPGNTGNENGDSPRRRRRSSGSNL